MVPFYIYYSMFGFQRVWDLIWAAGDMRVRGFLLGGTAGRTTLNGEGYNIKMDIAISPQLLLQILNLMTVPMHMK